MAVIALDPYTAEIENIKKSVLACLGIIWAQLKGHHETPKKSQHICDREDLPRDASRCNFLQSDLKKANLEEVGRILPSNFWMRYCGGV